MKKTLIAAAVLLGSLSLHQANAQININVNIGSQPSWGPTGYDYVQYYYLPDINCYYDVVHKRYYYPVGNSWHYSTRLPRRYANYNIYNSYKVVVNRPTPYRTNAQDIRDYGKYKGQHGQPIIRDSKDPKYHHDNGHKKGHNKGRR
ncbi:hypothetical protein A9P82_11470 [Arachidicoccus ginsenosidimutans]|uniref:hypothetical protein n=1 Tax=Arachidicoccus sp. BS20 TaxID=1850526 RepID=UPI0007F10303|nr:hypothetical protein [Arachidicoccus sp. BS20]ANI89850.1 hypothetical protein A9P82_11470 [Arachidicoccus sp. BS20]